MTNKTQIAVLLVTLVFSATLIGCPPLTKECENPDTSWCEGNVAKTCIRETDHHLVGNTYLRMDDCSAKGLACVKGQCIDSCNVVDDYLCRDTPTEKLLYVCTSKNSANLSWSQVKSATWSDKPCETCSSSCGCQADFVCRQGRCVPGLPLGQWYSSKEKNVDKDLNCCGRQRGNPCPTGQPCEQLDGTSSTCNTVGRCEACQTTADCDVDSCVSTGPGMPKVCLPESEATKLVSECRQDLNEVWYKDACGSWVEPAKGLWVSTECRENLGQIWRKDACGAWTELVKECGPGYRCESKKCILNLPEIEVSPTLLNFDDTKLSTSTTMTLSIGNIGYASLDVDEIVIESTSADLFTVTPTSVTVSVNQIVSISVKFTPKAVGSVAAKLFIRSKDADEPEITILMNAKAVP